MIILIKRIWMIQNRIWNLQHNCCQHQLPSNVSNGFLCVSFRLVTLSPLKEITRKMPLCEASNVNNNF